MGTAGNPTSILSLVYNYGTTSNNGNIQSVSYTGGGLSYTQTFGYDQLNRLTTSQEGASWSQTNSYDPYGNRSIVGGGLTFNATNNRITNAGYSYDAAGNLLSDGITNYTYDAEGHIKTVNSTTAYKYDGGGQRVRKLLGENIRFVYGIGGELIAEFDGSTGSLKKEYVYGGAMVATIEPTSANSNGTRYSTADHLGSPRVVTNSSGVVVSRHDYMPFGEELFAGIGGRTVGMGFSVVDGNRKKFTGYERDNETGLDFAQARYTSSTLGRFTSPDPFGGSMSAATPQSFNRYAYVGNNPVTHTDPTGLAAEGGGGFLPGANGALGRVKPGEGSISGTDGSNGQRWMMPYGEPGDAFTEAEAGPIEVTTEEVFAGLEAILAADPQNTLDNPLVIDSPPSVDCNISVAFSGSFEQGLPNGPGEFTYGPLGQVHGLGFTVYGSVADGGVGHLGADINPTNPGGAWTLEQWTSAYIKMNGVLDRNYQGGPATPDFDTQSPHQVTGNQFRWWDHPGVTTSGLKSTDAKFNFAVKAVNGIKQCEVRFRFSMTFSNGNWSVRWGRGNF